MTTTQVVLPSRRRQVWNFTRHLLEMVVAMMVGMVTLYPVWLLYRGEQRSAEMGLLVMAGSMTVPMVGWMIYRGHRLLPTIEMGVAMFSGFVVLFPFLWLGVMDEMGVMAVGHVLMVLFMLGAMLARRREYCGAC